MRKSNREITSPEALRQVLDSCDVCRLGLSDEGQPYIVPLNFGYRWDDHGLVIYCHCAREGRKLDILTRNHRVCVEFDQRHELKAGERACQWSMNFESIIGEGEAALVSDAAERLDGLCLIMQHYSDRKTWDFDETVLAVTAVIRIKIGNVSGKRLWK